MVRWCWVNLQCRGVLLIWIRVGQGPTALAVGAGGGCLDIFSLVYYFSFLSPSLWETARYRLKYCLKGPLSPKTTNQPFSPDFSSKISPQPFKIETSNLVYRFTTTCCVVELNFGVLLFVLPCISFFCLSLFFHRRYLHNCLR